MENNGAGANGLTSAQATQLGAKTLWIGDIESWMDENYIMELFQGIAQITSVKLIRDKIKGTPVGYGFVEFPNHEVAKKVHVNLNGQPIPGSQRAFKLNWASHGTSARGAGSTQSQAGNFPQQQVMQQPAQQIQQPMNPGNNLTPGHSNPLPTGFMAQQGGTFDPQAGQQGDYQVYVGNLDPNVSNTVLMQHIQKKFPSVFEAKVIFDQISRQSKGYGFLRFGSHEQAQSVISEMQGTYLLSRPLKLNYAAQKRRENEGGQNNRNSANMQGGNMGMNNGYASQYSGGAMGPPGAGAPPMQSQVPPYMQPNYYQPQPDYLGHNKGQYGGGPGGYPGAPPSMGGMQPPPGMDPYGYGFPPGYQPPPYGAPPPQSYYGGPPPNLHGMPGNGSSIPPGFPQGPMMNTQYPPQPSTTNGYDQRHMSDLQATAQSSDPWNTQHAFNQTAKPDLNFMTPNSNMIPENGNKNDPQQKPDLPEQFQQNQGSLMQKTYNQNSEPNAQYKLATNESNENGNPEQANQNTSQVQEGGKQDVPQISTGCAGGMQSLHYGQNSGMMPPNFQPPVGGMTFATEFSGNQPGSYSGASHQRGPSGSGQGQHTGPAGEQMLSFMQPNIDLQQQRAGKSMNKVLHMVPAQIDELNRQFLNEQLSEPDVLHISPHLSYI